MTTESRPARSPALLALQQAYRELRESRKMKSEPENAGRTPTEFIELSEDVADNYTPSGYLKSARLRE